MEKVFLLIVVVLIILAISDLIVGVSNDAVNFLNSAIGAKVAPLRTILIVAAAGVLFGATFSGGMMEVARKGIFYPGSFTFENIMIIFLAVMLTDVILLDLFNTFGMPTSTTVSIVFELLGSAVGIAVVRIKMLGLDMSAMTEYINSAKALAIISGILLSVVVSFTVGALVQYLSRLLFSFNFKKTMRYFGAIWGGIALTSITFFILIKGAKGASFMTAENVAWIKSHTWQIIIGSLITWTIIFQALNWMFKFNILKFVVFAGTFSLAMAFAGNDLVNFIGVPLAGFESYKIFTASEGIASDSFMMSALAGKVKTPTLYLLIAGLVMVITLWLSRKARSVVKTTLNLSDQDEVNERFQSSIFARSLVRQALLANKAINKVVPQKVLAGIEKRFDPAPYNEYVNQNPGVSFDLIRASVNLVVASILIAFATSLKLPLSTTYVTFMVAMGTSLADGAWGRESAVYRISGVITVIGGWFFTAFSAFTVALLVALAIYFTHFWGLIVLIPLAAFLMIRTHILHAKKEEEKNKEEERANLSALDGDSVYETCSENITSLLEVASGTVEKSIDALLKEKRKKLKEFSKTIRTINKGAKSLKKEVPATLQKLTEDSFESGHHYIEIIDYLREAMHCATHVVNPCYLHVDNNHTPVTEVQAESLVALSKAISEYTNAIVKAIMESDYSQSEELVSKALSLVDSISKTRKKHLKIIKKETGSTRSNMLFMDIMNESKNMVLHVNNIYKAFRDFSEQNRIQSMKSF